MQRDILMFFSKYIEKELGIVYSEGNHYQLQNRLEDIVRILGHKDLETFYRAAMVSINGDTKQLILDSATNNETSFFRDPRLFKAFAEQVLPTLATESKTRKIRIWSAACSYAQEPFSIAMLIREHFGPTVKPDFEILATDIAVKVLEKARTGKYNQLEVQRGLSSALLVKHFEKDSENFWTLSPAIRSMVSFERANLHDPMEKFGKFDVIFCRNVLIYQNVENKKKIIQKLSERLYPGGWLIMGAGESLIGLSDSFETVTLGETIFYRIRSNEGKKVA